MENYSALVFCQDGKEVVIKENDYVEFQTTYGFVKAVIYSIDSWECGEIHFKNSPSIEIGSIIKIIKVNKLEI